MSRKLSGFMILALAVAACDSTGPEAGARVAIRFLAVPSTNATLGANAAGAELDIVGSNGTLRLTDIHFIVDEFEMERQEDACQASAHSGTQGAANRTDDDDDDDDDECEEFEAGPFFVGLTLGSEVSVVRQDVPAGTYTRVKFEVEDTEFDDDDEDHHHAAGEDALLRAIRAAGFTEWPREASMVVSGSFTPATGPVRPFRAYFEAEIEVRKRFEQPLIVAEQASTISVEVDPSMWFLRPDGTVIDLSAFDYSTTRRVVEFEAKMREGFRHISH